MKVSVAAICDFAQVREGLLSVISAGINRLWRPQYPAPMGAMLALIVAQPSPAKPLSSRRLLIPPGLQLCSGSEIGWISGTAAGAWHTKSHTEG